MGGALPGDLGAGTGVRGRLRSTLFSPFRFCTRCKHYLIFLNKVDKVKSLQSDALGEGNLKGIWQRS